MIRRYPVLVFTLVCTAMCLFACSALPRPDSCAVDRSLAHESLSGVLWVQTSAEYQVAARTRYRDAMEQLDAALADTTRSAALEQEAPYEDKPAAVLMDIDETVLDNSPFQAQLVLDGVGYSASAWSEWVDRASATWIPGAREFIDHATSRHVGVFFVTNRTAEEEPGTRDNFAKLGYSVPALPDRILTKGEREGWTSDKTSRRGYLADDYRILLQIGDDLNDFVPAGATPTQRHRVAMTHLDRFGKDWFLIPNPQYGHWEQALVARDGDCDRLDDKRRHLRGLRNTPSARN